VLRQGLALSAIGVVVGLAAAVLLTRTLEKFVYGVSTLDPTTFAAVSVLLILVAAIASVVPAWRAVLLNPTTALRD
jgi:ABC-type lipoprotein release transport system permease subunit